MIGYLHRRALLLVMDNCEHVLELAARLVADLVQQCPGVVVLATSREALGVEGEQLWPVPPLSVEEAKALFVQRARAVAPDFRLVRPPPRRSLRSAPGWTGCRWASSSPPRGCG